MALYELQKIDSQIDEINKVKGELPLEVQDLEDEIAGLNTRIENIGREVEEFNSLTKQRRREIRRRSRLLTIRSSRTMFATTVSMMPSLKRLSIRSLRLSLQRSV